MSDAAARLLEAILVLSDEDRIAICDVIQESLTRDEDPELEAELNRRWRGYLNGERPGIPGEEVFRILRAEASKPSEG